MTVATRSGTFLLVLGCGLLLATPAHSQTTPDAAGPKAKPCNAVGATVGGALIGALLGGKRGAAIGGVLGASVCLAVNHHAKKVRSSEDVDAAYRKANNGASPEHATLVAYDTKLQPTDRIKAGEGSSLESYIEVAQGKDGVAPKIEEEFTIVGPDGKTLKTLRKPASEASTGGGFQTQFGFTLPKGVAEGQYELRTAVYLNGENVKQSNLPLQVVAATG